MRSGVFSFAPERIFCQWLKRKMTRSLRKNRRANLATSFSAPTQRIACSQWLLRVSGKAIVSAAALSGMTHAANGRKS